MIKLKTWRLGQEGWAEDWVKNGVELRTSGTELLLSLEARACEGTDMQD